MSRQPARPAVVFLDRIPWQGFFDLAAALRERGVRVERVTAEPARWQTRVHQSLESALFSRVSRYAVSWDGSGEALVPTDPHGVVALVRDDAVAVMAQEDLTAMCLTVTSGPASPARLVRDGVDPRVLVDKILQTATAADIGVLVPSSWETCETSSYPVVVKPRKGFGGVGVRVVADEPELLAAWDTVEALGEQPFLQEYLPNAVNTGGVALDGEVLVCVAYAPTPSPDKPTGPPRWVTVVDNPAALDSTARFVDALGYTGFFCLDWVMDDPDAPRLIDFNPRVFGSWALVQELGVDLLGHYLHAIGLGPRPGARPLPFGASAEQLVYPCPDVTSVAEVREWRSDCLRLVRQRRGVLGARWSRVMRARIMLSTVHRMAMLRSA